MTRRCLLASAAALCGAGAVVAKKAAPTWRWCDRPVAGYRIEVRAQNGDYMNFSGIDRAGFDRARETAMRCYPLDRCITYKETLTFQR